MTDCSICCEAYNKSTRKEVKCMCGDCEFSCCKSCVRNYLLNTTNDPHCMACKKGWEQEFVITNLNRSFYQKEYMKHRKGLLLDREVSKLPETMAKASIQKLVDAKEEEILRKDDELKVAVQLVKKLKNDRSKLYRECYAIRGVGKKEKQQFIMPCPYDDCRGFLSSKYKCELCDMYTCSKCHEVKGHTHDAEHTCDENSVKSAEMIKKETKPCPSCGTRIFKMVGCSQMWCTNCNTAFSWSTGQIDGGPVHNPHYYDFLRDNNGGEGGGRGVPRNPQDVLCGGILTWNQLHYDIVNRLPLPPPRPDLPLRASPKNKLGVDLTNLHRMISHITNYELRDMRTKVRDLENFEEFRIDYILKKISKDDLAKTVYRKDNLRRKYAQMLQVYEILSVVGIESFRNIHESSQTWARDLVDAEDVWSRTWGRAEVDAGGHETEGYQLYHKVSKDNREKLPELITNSIEEYKQLIEYCNKQFQKISVSYNQSVPQIVHRHNKWDWTTGNKFTLKNIK
jgi:hypothetical protein